MNGEILFKGKIQIIDNELYTHPEMEIIYRIININDIYFFAQEISTGSIFPTYAFRTRDNSNVDSMTFRNHSYLKSGKYFVFLPTDSKDVFKLSVYENRLEKPSIEEVNKYLQNYKNSSTWKKEMQRMEVANEYMCDLSSLKEKITMLREGNNVLNVDFNADSSSIDLTEIREFGYDLSTQDNLCNLIGREQEKKKITKNIAISGDSVILVGPSGSGKTSIVESIALDIKEDKNKWLKDKVIFYLNTGNLLSGTRYRGEFEDRMKKLIEFCQNNRERIILFIDEMHTLYGLGRTEDSSIDAMNILKLYISNGTITVIGATTENEYEKYLTNDPAFVRRFEKVNIALPDKTMNIQILLSYIKQLEDKYKIEFNFEEDKKHQIVEYILEATDLKNQRVVGDIKIENPTISKNILKESFTEAIYNEKEYVTVEEIFYAILSCDKLLPSFRGKVAHDIKGKLIEVKQEQKILELNSAIPRLIRVK